jgi:hypothetical protein
MGGGDDIQVQNPGNVDPRLSNPYVGAQMDYLTGMRDQFDASSMNAMDPYKYNLRRDDSMARSDVATSNRYAQMGLAGSSLAANASLEGRRQLGFAWDDRQLGDMQKSMAIRQGLTDDISKNIFGIQGQFGQYQDQMVQQKIAQQNAENQMWGSVMQLGGTIGGALLAGPAGAVAGGALAGSAGGGGSSIPYASSTYGSDMYSAAERTYGPYSGPSPYGYVYQDPSIGGSY